jgi:Cas3, HD domain
VGNLVSMFEESLGKSTGALPLYRHTMDVVKGAVSIVRFGEKKLGYGRERADLIVLAAFMHDIGKLNDKFQRMLRYVSESKLEEIKSIPKIKHEAETFSVLDELPGVIENSAKAIAGAVKEETGWNISAEIFGAVPEDVWTFAVTHHGLFYVSLEEWEGYDGPQRLIRREWTTFYPREVGRRTLLDLLLRYHPLGGAVIVADLLASYAHENGRDLDFILAEHEHPGDIIENVLLPNAESIEASIRRYDPRDYSLRATLDLLLGGV